MSYRTCEGGIAASFSEGWQEIYPPCEGGSFLTFEQSSTLRRERVQLCEALAKAAGWEINTPVNKAAVIPFALKR